MAAVICERDRYGGMCLRASRDVMAGEVLLEERPLVAVAAAAMRHRVCADCLCVGDTVTPCAGCGGQAALCNRRQCAMAHKGSRHADVCWALVLVDAQQYPSAFELLSLVLHAASLEEGPPFDAFWGMSTGGGSLDVGEQSACDIVSNALSSTNHTEEVVLRLKCLRARVAELLKSQAGLPSGSSSSFSAHASRQNMANEGAGAGVDPLWSLLVRGVCLRDKANDFALGCPMGDGCDPEVRVTRAIAVLPLLSRTNHSCIPNVVRFDRFDAEACPADSATQLVAMDHIAQGTELTLSYLPLNDGGAEGRKWLSEEYGFSCACVRCRVEERTEYGIEEGQIDGDVTGTPTYLFLFFLKHRCDECGGTLSPHMGLIPHLPDGAMCNRCGSIRTGQEFEMLVQRAFEEDGEDWESGSG